MRLLRGLVIAAGLAATSAAASAQRLGTVELGAFAHYTTVKNDAALGAHSSGYGARGGLFLARWIELEGEYGHGSVANGGIRYPEGSWSPIRALATLNLPIAPRVKLLLGAGMVDTWKGDITNNEFEEGVSVLAGLRVCFGDAWSVRPEVVYDRTPEPADWMQRNYLMPTNQVSTRWQLRIGVSRFFVRGTTTCHESAERPATRLPDPRASGVTSLPGTAITPAAPLPAATPMPVSATLNAAPGRIVSGQSATLTWNATNAVQCSAPWMTGTSTSGSQTVYPTSNVTYAINCTGAGAPGSASAAISVSQPPPPAPPPAPRPAPREILRLTGVHFDFDKSTIKPAGRTILDSAVVLLNNSPDTRIEIQGHTDSMGSDQYNQALSERRALSVRDYLVSKGILASRLTATGFGESRPVESNDTAAGRAQNRRVVLIDMQQ